MDVKHVYITHIPNGLMYIVCKNSQMEFVILNQSRPLQQTWPKVEVFESHVLNKVIKSCQKLYIVNIINMQQR